MKNLRSGTCYSVIWLFLTLSLKNAAQMPGGSSSRQDSSSDTSIEPLPHCENHIPGSPYITLDSWIYTAILRLYSLGFVDQAFLGLRPWTRASAALMIENIGDRLQEEPGPVAEEARRMYASLRHELDREISEGCHPDRYRFRFESAYSLFRGISGTPLRDSYHLGSTVINDYGRPYESGFNNFTGLSGYANAGRFVLYVRGEFQNAPSATGYRAPLANALSGIDRLLYSDPLTRQTTYYYPQATIPLGPLSSVTQGRIIEAYVSALLLNHAVSFGKHDQWLGPAQGASFAYSNNAENIYGFQINRIEPLHIPLLSRITGPFRYEFLIGSLHGHRFISNPAFTGDTKIEPNVLNPGAPWVHVEKISFKPTENLEFGFERTVIWGGKGHEPITLHTFLKSFFSLTAPGLAIKDGSGDPGARFGTFDFTYRMPYLRNWLTLYADGEVHDDVSPIDAPRRAAWRPGLYLSHVPGLPRLDVRAEAAWTDPSISNSIGGDLMYYEGIQKQGYTNNGQLFGDWIGREDKGGQAWITYHLSGNEWLQINARHQKAAKDFIASSTTQYGTTLNDLGFQMAKRIRNNFEVDGNFTMETYKAPIYLSGQQTVTTTGVEFRWLFPSD